MKPTTTDDSKTSTPNPRIATMVRKLQPMFMAFAEGLTHLTTARSDLAPKFMKTFEAWAKETGGTFVEFVQQLDDKVPSDREGYKAHTSYMAADYLRRLQARLRQPREPVPEGERPVTPLVALAKIVATVLPAVDPTGTIWAAFIAELHWSPEQAERLKALSEKQGAIKLPPRTKHTLMQRAA